MRVSLKSGFERLFNLLIYCNPVTVICHDRSDGEPIIVLLLGPVYDCAHKIMGTNLEVD